MLKNVNRNLHYMQKTSRISEAFFALKKELRGNTEMKKR